MGFLPGGSDTTIRHNTQITHITQNNTPYSNRNTAHRTTQTIKDIIYNEYNANKIRTITNTITTTIK
jgi:hypothetical protein